jgi:site-specific DNA recombinase
MSKSTNRRPSPAARTLSADTPEPVALYARVSTEDQAENDTVDAQLDFLRNLCQVFKWPIVGEYVDEGVSGTVPLDRRPDGGRLLADAEAGRFRRVAMTRVSRFSRQLDVALGGYMALDAFGVSLLFAQESLDTSQPAGELLFGILGSFAQHDHRTIVEQTARGKVRVAAKGTYTGGPVAVGFDLDDENNYRLSARPVPQLGEAETEASMMRGIFVRIAGGQTTAYEEFRRLIALGVPRYTRYGHSSRRRMSGEPALAVETPRGWTYSGLVRALRNPIYKGEGEHKSRYGHAVRPVPPLVDAETWARAQAALIDNRRLSRKNAKRDYWLRGLVRCANCGGSYAGCPHHGKRTYICTKRHGVNVRRGDEACRAKRLPAAWLEEAAWAECRAFILDPGATLEEARLKLRAQMAESTTFADRRRATLAALAEKETERERALTAYRKGWANDEETQAQLDAISREAGELREALESIRARAALVEAQEATLAESTAMLATIRDELEAIDATDDWARRQEVMAGLVRVIEVETRANDAGRLSAEVRLRLRLRVRPGSGSIELRTP